MGGLDSDVGRGGGIPSGRDMGLDTRETGVGGAETDDMVVMACCNLIGLDMREAGLGGVGGAE